jgi:hypothetical protein
LIFSIVYRDFSAFAIPDKIIGTIPALKFYVTVGDSNVGPTIPIRGSTNVAVTEGHREFPVAKVKKAFISWEYKFDEQ